MSVMSTRKQARRKGQSAEARQGRAYKAVAAKAWRAGNEDRADRMLDMADYWTARASCNRDKDIAVDGAVIVVEVI